MVKIIKNRNSLRDSNQLPSYINLNRGNELVSKNSAPKQITTLRFGTITTSSIDLEWNEPNDGGNHITAYTIARTSDASGSYSTIFSGNIWPLSYTDDLTSGSLETYTYKVSSINSLGTSGDSNLISTTLL